jgi:hypothetical protein
VLYRRLGAFLGSSVNIRTSAACLSRPWRHHALPTEPCKHRDSHFPIKTPLRVDGM